MMSVHEYVGSLVEVDCGLLGVYRGVIEKIHLDDQSVVISNASNNGKKLVFSDVTIAAEDISDIKFVGKQRDSPQRGVLAENRELRTSPRSQISGKRSPTKTPRLDRNVDSQNAKSRTRTFSNSLSTSRSQRDNICFNVKTQGPELLEEFDFEKNLELFDKKSVFEEITRSKKTDNGVRLVDCNLKKKTEAKYRHDENVLGDVEKIISREEKKVAMFTAVPSGQEVRAISRCTRDQILTEGIKLGLSGDSLREAMARNISSLILQQNNRNTVVFLVSPDKQSAPLSSSHCGVTAARQLAGKIPNVYVMSSRPVGDSRCSLSSEIELCKLAGVKIIDSSTSLNSAVDIVVGCTLHPYLDQCAQRSSTTVMLVDPAFYSPNLANIVLFPLLPLTSSVPAENDAKCKIYICDLGVPLSVYTSCSVKIVSNIYSTESFISRICHSK